jgi:hypothetical protein
LRVFAGVDCEAICRRYDNRTTIGFEHTKIRSAVCATRFAVWLSKVTVPLEHHARVRMPQSAGDRVGVSLRLTKALANLAFNGGWPETTF